MRFGLGLSEVEKSEGLIIARRSWLIDNFGFLSVLPTFQEMLPPELLKS
jgi:hypothetical protein